MATANEIVDEKEKQTERATGIRANIHKAHSADDRESARAFVRALRDGELYRHLGFKSFHDWAKADSPWSINYTYKLSKASMPAAPEPEPPDPEAAEQQGIVENIPAGHHLKDTPDGPRVVPNSAAPSSPQDNAGQDLPDELIEVFRVSNYAFKTMTVWIYQIRQTLLNLGATPGGAELAKNNQMEIVREHLKSIERDLRRSWPWAKCLYCSGTRKTCRACEGRGWLTEEQWAQATRTQQQPAGTGFEIRKSSPVAPVQ